jgi:hypothetical protein
MPEARKRSNLELAASTLVPLSVIIKAICALIIYLMAHYGEGGITTCRMGALELLYGRNLA